MCQEKSPPSEAEQKHDRSRSIITEPRNLYPRTNGFCMLLRSHGGGGGVYQFYTQTSGDDKLGVVPEKVVKISSN